MPTSSDVSLLMFAATFAAEKHTAQRRKNLDASPYINHPLAVAALLAQGSHVVDVELLIAAVLHDTVEDTDTSFAELTALFGHTICDLVGEVTDDKSLLKARCKELQIENAPYTSDRAKQLKIADKICNIRDIDTANPTVWDTDRKVQYLDWAVRVVEGCRGVSERLDKLFDQTITAARGRLQKGEMK